jgi:hypothetical protein
MMPNPSAAAGVIHGPAGDESSPRSARLGYQATNPAGTIVRRPAVRPAPTVSSGNGLS